MNKQHTGGIYSVKSIRCKQKFFSTRKHSSNPSYHFCLLCVDPRGNIWMQGGTSLPRYLHMFSHLFREVRP